MQSSRVYRINYKQKHDIKFQIDGYEFFYYIQAVKESFQMLLYRVNYNGNFSKDLSQYSLINRRKKYSFFNRRNKYYMLKRNNPQKMCGPMHVFFGSIQAFKGQFQMLFSRVSYNENFPKNYI